MATKIRSDLKEVESGGYQLSNADWKMKVSEKASQEWDSIFIQWFLARLLNENTGNKVCDIPYVSKISRIKFKICELATGNQHQEEWLVLPENLLHAKYSVDHGWMYFSDKNLAAIEIELSRLNIGWMLLILNLATRKRYWITYVSLENKIYTSDLITDVELEELALPGEFEIRQMRLKPNRIEIKFHTEMYYHTLVGMPEVLLG